MSTLIFPIYGAQTLCLLTESLSHSPSLSHTHLTVKQVFSSMEFLGWYTVGDLPSEEDVKFHEQVGDIVIMLLIANYITDAGLC